MRTISSNEIENAVYRLALKAGVNLTPSAKRALTCAAQAETGELARYALSLMAENADVAVRESLPVCQDTGLCVVMLEVGQDVHIAGAPIAEAANAGVRRAYADGCFRKSCCDPLTRVNTGDNTPAVLYTEIVPGDRVRVTVLPKGFGSENMSKLYMLTPAAGKEGIVNAVVSAVRDAGSHPCPPVIVGVGVGGTFDKCAYLAKKALLRPVGAPAERADVRELEERALSAVNALQIGAQGFGGDITALSVAIEVLPTHIAGLPVAVNMQCHCARCEEEIL